MSRSLRALALLGTLLVTISTSAASHRRLLFLQPNASAAPGINTTEAPLDQGLIWRALGMRDEHGFIPQGVAYLANAFRRQQLAALIPLPIKRLSANARIGAASTLSPSSWTSRGPQNVGGRTRALLIDPNTPSTMYAGAVSGGIWKSTDGGASWTSLNDFMANIAIMTLAFDPSVANRSVIYAGTGELEYYRADGVQGAGIFKSTDFGAHWTQLTDRTGSATDPATWKTVSRIAVNNSGVALAAATNGIYRSLDGGSSWTQTFGPAYYGFGLGIQVAFDPNNSQNAVAVDIDNDAFGFRHKALYSTDAGAHWSATSPQLPATSPDPYHDRIELAYAPSQSGVVYASVNTSSGQIWKSTNGGASYTQMTTSGSTGCTWGACALWVSPTDPNFLLIGGIGVMHRSTDGGVTSLSIGSGITLSHDVHDDQHLIVTSPTFSSGNRQAYVCTDAGIFRADDVTTVVSGNHAWVDLNATYQTAEYYGATGNIASGSYIGGTQDNGTLRTSGLPNYATLIVSGDGGLTAIDPTDPASVYGEYQFLNIFRAAGASWMNIARDGGPNQLTDADTDLIAGSAHTGAFIAPFVLDHHNPNVMYAAGKSVWKTTNVKASLPDWFRIRQPANDVALALAVAPSNSDVIWVTQADGAVAKTETATSVTPSWTMVHDLNSIDPLPKRNATGVYIDPNNSAIVYLTFGGYTTGNVWRTTDGGSSWTNISGTGLTGLPPAPARTIVRHPRNTNVLFVGTEIGLYESDDAGITWTPSSDGPNDAPVYQVDFVYGSEQLLIATHGRGLWTADTSTVASAAPTNLTATATSTTSITISWNSYPGATSYLLYRSNGGSPYIGTSVSTTSTTQTVSASTTYLYQVRAVIGTAMTDYSNVDLATTIMFTDDATLPSKIIKASHLQELRDATNAVLTAANLATVSFPALTPGTTTVLTNDILDVRSALVRAYYSIGKPIPAFTYSINHGTTIKAVDLQELRDLTK